MHETAIRRTLAALSFLAAATATLTATAPSVARAQIGSSVTASAGTATIARGGKGTVTVTLALKPGWHIYATAPGADSYIPTTVTATPQAGLTVGKAMFPKAATMVSKADPKPINIYENKAVITLPVTVAKTAKPGVHALKVSVGYQTCNAKVCLPPTTVPLTANVTVK